MFLIILIIFITGYCYFSFTKFNYKRLNFLQRFLLNRALSKWIKIYESIAIDKYAITDYEALLKLLNVFERYLVRQILTIDPKDLGFKGPFYSLEPATNLIKIDSFKFKNELHRETGIQYCPAHSYNDFVKMSEEMYKEIGKRIYIDSGYRSPGRQAYLFLYYLIMDNDYCLLENAKWIALPGYSEHGANINNAIDIATEEGINGFSEDQCAKDFENTIEFKWLLENANKFNFYLSYPKDNDLGVAYEPWHWHWEIKQPK